MEEIFAIVSAVLAAGAALCSILTFWHLQKKDAAKGTIDITWLKSDMRYIKTIVENLHREIQAQTEKQNEMSIYLAKEKERLDALEDRMIKVEKKVNRNG